MKILTVDGGAVGLIILEVITGIWVASGGTT